MIVWRQAISIGLSVATVGSLSGIAWAAPSQEELLGSDGLVQIPVDAGSLTEQSPTADMPTAIPPAAIVPLTEAVPGTAEELTEMAPNAGELSADSLIDTASMAEVKAVPPEVIASLSQEQVAAIATIIQNADAVQNTAGANLPTEVLAQLDTLPGVQQQVNSRRRLPFNLARRLRLPQVVAALIRQPRQAALMMLGNRILVVNPVTGAILGSVVSAL
ncbi:hypothetical protein C7271_17225 [filamentous cyanobacterium CCP5]|nr:hypothetical protein C7271_17225 [filamentous cyanobacterium CCP5]